MARCLASRQIAGATPPKILFLIKLKYQNKLQLGRDDADAGKNDPRSRWRRATFLATRLHDGNKPFQRSGIPDEEGAIRKQLETQHWLEMIDGYLPLSSNVISRNAECWHVGNTVMARIVEFTSVISLPAGRSRKPSSQGLYADGIRDNTRLIRALPGSTITVGGKRRTRSRISFDGATSYLCHRSRLYD